MSARNLLERQGHTRLAAGTRPEPLRGAFMAGKANITVTKGERAKPARGGNVKPARGCQLMRQRFGVGVVQ